jgi:prepilin-type N-terminal cleavage/methylation domain-containing protein
MSFNNIKTRMKSERGFTIVELLIVIVVIGILAAITIVAYNGVTARANTTSAQANATNLAKKIEAYNAENAGYPKTLSLITASTASSSSFYVAASSLQLSTSALAAAPATNSTLVYNTCGTTGTTTAPANWAAITAVTGVIVNYWSYTSSTSPSVTAGTTSGSIGTFPIACFPSAT